MKANHSQSRIPRRFYRATGLASALLVAWLAPVALFGDERAVDRTIEATATATIEIENTSGEVTIKGWDRNEVTVTGWIGEDVEELVVEGGRNSIVIEVEIEDGRGWRNRDTDADLEIMVPKGARLDVETVSASIDVSDFDGRLDAESVSGSIDVAGELSQADLETVSGSIEMSGANTRTSAESVSGSIRIKGASQRVEASTVSGRVEVEAGEIHRGDFESVSGSVSVECTLASDARLEASSHSGNVTVMLPADVSASFEASTFSGSIDNDFGPEAARTSKWVPSKSLDFTTGRGDAEVMLETFSGNVRLRKQ
jgi:DUF4097 and DUF4098 domain-containing protein YvlB